MQYASSPAQCLEAIARHCTRGCARLRTVAQDEVPYNNTVMTSEPETDLLPWILGGVIGSVAAFATVAIVYGSANSSAKHGVGAAVPLAAVAAPALPATGAPPPAVKPMVLFDAPPPAARPKGVWTCTVNGQPIYSDTPCGDDAAVRDVGMINTMPAAPVTPQGSYPPDQNYATAPIDQNPAQVTVNNTLVLQQVNAVRVPPAHGFAARELPPRPHNRDREPAARR